MAISRRALLAATLSAPVAAGTGIASAVSPPAAPAGNALWIWGTARRDWPLVAQTMAREGFGTAFLSIRPEERRELGAAAADLDAALAPFADRGLAVLLVGGDPAWADGRPIVPALEALVRMAGSATRVAGLQLDIEPYTLPLWRTGEEGKRQISAALLDRLKEARAALPAGKSLGMVLHPAFANAPLPPGYGSGTLADGVVERCDSLVVMAYRNKPDALERFAGRLLDALDANPKPWRFGITVQGGPDQALISYADAPWERVKTDMAELDARGRRRGAGRLHAGVAVHAWASLAPKLAG